VGFTAASVVLTATPLDELPLDEMMARSAHRVWRRIPKVSRRETISRRRMGASALLIPAQLLAWYLMWSYTITGGPSPAS
jgi:hypothetical protein